MNLHISYWLRAAVALLIISGLSAPVAASQPPHMVHYLRALEQGNKAYNDSRYDEAQEFYILAIQHHPEQSDPYKNLARTYFWKEQYPIATTYYDIFLRLSPQAEDAEQIRAERRLAATRASGHVWSIPENQQMALKALENELTEGRAYTVGGGGAWGLYRSLLRMHYAQPELATLRKRLLRRLIDEFEGALMSPLHQLSPVLDMDAWALQRERLKAASELADDELIVDIVQRRGQIVAAAEALLMHRDEDAVTLAQQAAEDNPDLLFVQWFYIAALTRTQAYPQALEISEQLIRRLMDTAPTQVDYARVVHAAVLHHAGRHSDAAQIYLELLHK